MTSSKITIITTVSDFTERRGLIERLDSLINFFLSKRFEITILSLCFKKKINIKYKGIQVRFIPITFNDCLSALSSVFRGNPLSVSIFQRKNILLSHNKYICFHLIRSIQFKLLNLNEKVLYLDFCESLASNFSLRSNYSKISMIKKFIFSFEAKKLSKFEKIVLNNYKFSQYFFINQYEKDIANLKDTKKALIINRHLTKHLTMKKIDVIHKIKSLFFVGHIDYEPNIDSIITLANLLVQFNKKCKLHIVGRINNKNKRILLKYKNLILYDYLHDYSSIAKLSKYGWAYMNFSTGTQNKVFDYLDNNLFPIVSKNIYNTLTSDYKRYCIVVHDLKQYVRTNFE